MTQTNDIAALREQIATLQAEQRTLQGQPLWRGDVELQIRGLVHHLHALGSEALSRELERSAAGAFPTPFHVQGNLPIGQVNGVAPFSVDLGPLLVALLGEEAVLATLLKNKAIIPVGLKPAERTARLAAIAAELDRLEVEEEALIESSEMFGEQITRRRDARPEIILAVTA